MTREQLKRAKRRVVLQTLAISAFCITVVIGVSFLAEAVMPAVGVA